MTNLKIDIEYYKDVTREINLDIAEMNELEEKILTNGIYNYPERRQDLQICKDRLNKMIDRCNHQLETCKKAIRTDLQGFTDFERELIELKVLNGLKWKEMGKKFGKSGRWARKEYKRIVNK